MSLHIFSHACRYKTVTWLADFSRTWCCVSSEVCARQSHPLLDVGMLQGLVDADPLGWVEHQNLIQQVFELNHLLPLFLWQSLTTNHVVQ